MKSSSGEHADLDIVADWRPVQQQEIDSLRQVRGERAERVAFAHLDEISKAGRTKVFPGSGSFARLEFCAVKCAPEGKEDIEGFAVAVGDMLCAYCEKL